MARYGYSTSLFSWEFFNEVDLIDDYDSDLVAKWHAEMARYLRAIDPRDHLITTSYKPLSVRDATVVLTGIRPGRWTVEYFGSHSGKVTKSIMKNVRADGRCVIDLPETVSDAAFRLHRQ